MFFPNVPSVVAGWSRAFTCETWHYGKVTDTHRWNYLSIARGPTRHTAQNGHDMIFARTVQPKQTVHHEAYWHFNRTHKGDHLSEWKIAVNASDRVERWYCINRLFSALFLRMNIRGGSTLILKHRKAFLYF